MPTHSRTPQDHLKPAVQLEAEGVKTTDVAWRDHTFTVTTDPDDYPVPAVMAFERGQVLVGLETLLGEEQWAEFMKTKPIKRDATSLLETMGEALGLGD